MVHHDHIIEFAKLYLQRELTKKKRSLEFPNIWPDLIDTLLGHTWLNPPVKICGHCNNIDGLLKSIGPGGVKLPFPPNFSASGAEIARLLGGGNPAAQGVARKRLVANVRAQALLRRKLLMDDYKKRRFAIAKFIQLL